MADFTKIGNGFIHESKKGNKSINLVLDPNAKDQLLEHDWERGIYIFKSRKKTKKGNPFYNICVSMPDDYEYERGTSFSKKKKKEEKDQWESEVVEELV